MRFSGSVTILFSPEPVARIAPPRSEMFVTFTEPVCNLVEQRKGLAPNCAVPVNQSVGFSFLGRKILVPKQLRRCCPTVARVWQEPKAKGIILTMKKEEAEMVAPRTIIAGLKVAYHP
jgi:hypothetical protein